MRQRYRTSELVIMAWRSREQSVNMGKMRKHHDSEPSNGDYPPDTTPPKRSDNPKVFEDDNTYILPRDVNNGARIPKRFFDKEGELNLSKATGPEAVRYLNNLGLNIPTILR